MELTNLHDGKKVMTAYDKFSVAAGEKVKVDIAQVKKFEEECPENKKWTVHVSIRLEEEDV